MISLRNITWRSRFDSRSMSIRDLSLTGGKLLWIRGPSGSGKTTLFNLLSGVIDSEINDEVRKIFPTVTFVMHGSSLLPWLTIDDSFRKDNLLRGNSLQYKPQHDRFISLLRSFLLDQEVLNKFPRQLSMGMRQRIEVARALACGASLVLFDESFSGIDDDTRLIVLEKVKSEVNSSGCAVCFTSHNDSDGSCLADMAVFVHEGVVKSEEKQKQNA